MRTNLANVFLLLLISSFVQAGPPVVIIFADQFEDQVEFVCSDNSECSHLDTNPVCDNSNTCQGTLGLGICSDFLCATNHIDDDSACAELESNDCGPYPPVSCTTDIDQISNQAGFCATSCSISADCDDNAVCNGSQQCVFGSNMAPTADCGPTPIFTDPRVAVIVDGSASNDPESGTLTTLWEVIGSPNGAQASPSGPGNISTSFRPDIAGEYTLQLTVTDPDLLNDKCSVTVNAIPSNDIYVELVWESQWGDLDLYLTAPDVDDWGAFFEDDVSDIVTYWANPNTSWGGNLDAQDSGGHGPRGHLGSSARDARRRGDRSRGES